MSNNFKRFGVEHKKETNGDTNTLLKQNHLWPVQSHDDRNVSDSNKRQTKKKTARGNPQKLIGFALSFFIYALQVFQAEWHDESGLMTWKSASYSLLHHHQETSKSFIIAQPGQTSEDSDRSPDRWRQTAHTSYTYKSARNIVWIFSFILTVALLTRFISHLVESRSLRRAKKIIKLSS